jgi:hypothetical protein
MSSHACKHTFLEFEDFNYMNISSWMLSLSKLISLGIGFKKFKIYLSICMQNASCVVTQ